MMKTWTQKELYDFLSDNSLGVKVHIGSLEDMNNQDYIFLNYLDESPIDYDNQGLYRTRIQITIATKTFAHRRTLIDYVKSSFNCTIQFDDNLNEHEYFGAMLTTSIFLYD